MDATTDTPEGAKKEEVEPTVNETVAPVVDAAAEPATAPETAAPPLPIETEIPVETKPAAASPAEATPAESKSVELETVESNPVRKTAVEAPHVEAEAPVEAKVVETKTVEIKTFDTTSTDSPPIETTVVETKVTQTTAVEILPVEDEAAEVKADETTPAEPQPTETKVAETKAVETEPIKSEPVEATPGDVKPVEAVPIEAKPVEVVEDFSDPDEDDLDDLDDLDDMLDDFSTVKLEPKKAGEAVVPGKPEAPKDATEGKKPEAEDAFSEEEFAKQLQAGMADLLGELEQSPDMQTQFEDIFKQIAAADGTADPAEPSTSAKPTPQASAEDASFQETIRRTMERMQTSGDQATAAAASGSGDDFMSEMLKQMSSGDLGGLGGDGNEEEFSKMLMGMMEQLTNKEILYEPMKELDDKFPDWLTKNRSSTPKEDLKRYEEQQAVVREIVAKFEEKTYSDSNAADREFIVDKMQKMQAAGSPPSDLVGDMSSAQEALNPGDEACNPQ